MKQDGVYTSKKADETGAGEREKAAREILDVLVKNHLHRLEASRLLFNLSNDVERQDPEVRISEIRLSFCDD